MRTANMGETDPNISCSWSFLYLYVRRGSHVLQILIMPCRLPNGIPGQLNFTIPESGHKKNFILYLRPDEGEQRRIIKCKWFKTYDCETEYGFRVEFPTDTQALITFPEGFKDEPGSLYYQIAGQNVSIPAGCSWERNEKCMADNIVECKGHLNATQMHGNTSIIIGVVIGVAVAFILFLFIGILCYRRHKKSKNLNKSQISEMAEQGSTVNEQTANVDQEHESTDNKISGACSGSQLTPSPSSRRRYSSERDGSDRPFILRPSVYKHDPFSV